MDCPCPFGPPQAPTGPDLRTIEIEGEPWFVAVDVLRCLGLRTGNGEHYKKLGPDEAASSNRTALGLPEGKPMKIVSESGLYKLIMRSDKDTARPFQDWVTKGQLGRLIPRPLSPIMRFS